MKTIRILAAVGAICALSPGLVAQVAVLSGNHVPNANVIEAPNTMTNAALFTTVVFAGTNWIAEDGFIKMTTAPIRGIWFGSDPIAGGDPAAFLPGSTSDGNKLQLRSLLTAGSQSWSAYFQDTNGYHARMDFQATDNSQNRPGVTVELDTGFVTVSGPDFDLSELHDFEIHLHNGIVAYSINGVEVLRGPAVPLNNGARVIVGDPTGSTPTGTGSMWIDSFSFDNEAGPLAPIPEPATVALFLGLAALGIIARRHGHN
ncbi:MAG: PEP-CTERM sorting domain-containing protein [Opitutales bacterium]|nr:PEP-CTERM sorting domain-containing protein [Opitutales bacterium]